MTREELAAKIQFCHAQIEEIMSTGQSYSKSTGAGNISVSRARISEIMSVIRGYEKMLAAMEPPRSPIGYFVCRDP